MRDECGEIAWKRVTPSERLQPPPEPGYKGHIFTTNKRPVAREVLPHAVSEKVSKYTLSGIAQLMTTLASRRNVDDDLFATSLVPAMYRKCMPALDASPLRKGVYGKPNFLATPAVEHCEDDDALMACSFHAVHPLSKRAPSDGRLRLSPCQHCKMSHASVLCSTGTTATSRDAQQATRLFRPASIARAPKVISSDLHHRGSFRPGKRSKIASAPQLANFSIASDEAGDGQVKRWRQPHEERATASTSDHEAVNKLVSRAVDAQVMLRMLQAFAASKKDMDAPKVACETRASCVSNPLPRRTPSVSRTKLHLLTASTLQDSKDHRVMKQLGRYSDTASCGGLSASAAQLQSDCVQSRPESFTTERFSTNRAK